MFTTDIEFTRVGTADLKTLYHLSRKTFIDSFAHLNTQENMDAYLKDHLSEKKLSDEINTVGSEFYFAESDGEPIGYIKLNSGTAQNEPLGDEALEIERIYVLQDHQGKKVGQFLFDKAIELANQASKTYVWLGVWEHNESAIRFYRRQGFEPFASHPFMLGDDVQTDILMKLPLK